MLKCQTSSSRDVPEYILSGTVSGLGNSGFGAPDLEFRGTGVA